MHQRCNADYLDIVQMPIARIVLAGELKRLSGRCSREIERVLHVAVSRWIGLVIQRVTANAVRILPEDCRIDGTEAASEPERSPSRAWGSGVTPLPPLFDTIARTLKQALEDTGEGDSGKES